MSKNLFWALSLSLWSAGIFGQTTTSLGVWLDHFPYGRGIDIEESQNLTYLATEQGVLIYDVDEKTIERISKVSGLSDVGLTEIAFSEDYGILMIGYDNGSLDIYDGGEIKSIPDLRLSSNFSGLKRINHIQFYDSIAFIATNFGILAFDLESDLIREQYIIGPGGSNLAVAQTAVFRDTLYAATEQGLFFVPMAANKFLFSNWSRLPRFGQALNKICVFDQRLFVNRDIPPNGDSIYYREGNTWLHFDRNEIARNRDLRESKGMLIVVNSFSARAYDRDFAFLQNRNPVTMEDSTFSPVAAVAGTDPQNFWIGDQINGLWHLFQQFVLPVEENSPATKAVWAMRFEQDELFVAPGAYNDVGSPLFNNDGFFSLQGLNWQNFNNQNFGGYQDIVSIIGQPEIPERIYASSYGQGILELQREGVAWSLLRIINESTTDGALPATGGGEHRVAEMSSDQEGNIWFGNALTDRPLGVIRPDGSVESFAVGAAGSGANVLKLIATSQNQVWMQLRNNGIAVVRLEDGVPVESKLLSASEGSGNLPSATVLSFAEDQNGEIWIGTNEGLAVIFNPLNIFEANRSFDASILVIDPDGTGVGERVLGSEAINDIAVDGANKKWFATQNSGVFYTSANGRQQELRFERNASPLPSNNVLDIEIDPRTGRVFFGTDQGILAFQGQATEGVERMNDVFAYPNPVPPDYQGPILIRGLVTNAQVKITDIEGNIVFETTAEGGQAVWDGRRFNGQRVRSGVYLAYITDDLGANTAVAKIMIVN